MKTHDVDVLVVGSGAGGLTAAIVAKEHGGDALVIEKTDQYGGTTATSGGGIWIPCNHLMAKHGESDTEDAALTYLKATVGDEVSEERLRAYVQNAPKMLKFLEDNSEVKFNATPYADYFPDKPGGKDGYRTLDPHPISAASIGKEFDHVRPPHTQTIFWGFTLTVNEAKIIITRTRGWQWVLFKLMATYWLDIPFRLKTKRHRRLSLGNALIVRALKSVFKKKIPVWRNTKLIELVTDNGKVTGAIIEKDGETMQINTRRGVIMAAGGFEHNRDMRAKHLPSPTDSDWSAANGHNTGDSIIAAQTAGAGVSLMDAAWWGPAVRLPREDRSRILFAERALPGIYIINKKGERFLNEAASYDEVGRQLYNAEVPAYVVFDANVRARYPVGPILPSSAQPDIAWPDKIKSIVKKANSLDELAELIEVPAEALKTTAARVTQFAKDGVDEDFNKGGNTYDRYYGDQSVTPNPCMGPLEKGPFYAFPIYPGDIGTKGGIDVDIHGQALTETGAPIQGLYATGNNASSVMGRTYPGAGSTIGPAMTFGYVAAKHAMGAND